MPPRKSTRQPSRTARPPTRDRLVSAALDLILENGGCRGVNLRQIAARAGCAHTNAYNYFASLEDLFWAAVHRAVELQLADTTRQMQTPAAAADPLRTFLAVQVAYAQENPGLYRLFWLEALEGAPPLRVLERLGEARALWVRYLGGRLAALRSSTDPAWAGQIVHGYFHGEVCKLIGRRAFVPQSADARDRIVAHTLALTDLVATAAPRPA